MIRHLLGLAAVLMLSAGALLQAHPKPSPYPTYNVVNNTGKEITFLPVFTMLTRQEQLVRSDRNIARAVFEQIKAVERIRFLEPTPDVAGKLLVGEDQARDAVAIWPEPDARMGRFSIFVGGLSGEAVALTDDDGKVVKNDKGEPVILHKTLRLDYHVPGDEVYPQLDKVVFTGGEWVMR